MIYVDDMNAKFEPPHRPGITYVMCHLIGDDEAKLHEIAQRSGVARKWYQQDHYDIAQGAKKKAIHHGAIEITWMQASALMMGRKRKFWTVFPNPEEAIDLYKAAYAAAKAAAKAAAT